MIESDGKRLNKFISESGYCSRREADKLIEQNCVSINGKPPGLGAKVMPGDKVMVEGTHIKARSDNKSDRVYIAYNKPVGITCTSEPDVQGNIIDAIGHKKRIFPIGRLDKPSEGLIFLTSDGDIVNKILRAENAHDKEYLVTVDKPLTSGFADRMSKGVRVLGTMTKPCKVALKGKYSFKIVLTQGLNRQIRRMCEELDYDVKSLKRTRIMSVGLAGLKPGQWRNLTQEEMAEISKAVAGSSGEGQGDAKRSTRKPANKKARKQSSTEYQRIAKQNKKPGSKSKAGAGGGAKGKGNSGFKSSGKPATKSAGGRRKPSSGSKLNGRSGAKRR